MENEVNEVVEVANDTTNQEIDYKAKFEEANKEANRLNAIIQKHKKEPKANGSVESPIMWEAEVQRMLDEREFYKANPEMAEYKEAISDFTSTGKVSLSQAKKLVLDTNPDIVARQNTQNANFTAWVPDYSTGSYSKEELWDMNQADYNAAMSKIEQGKAIIK